MKVDLEKASSAVRELLIALGHDPDEEGLRGTPGRVARAMQEMTSGYDLDVAQVLCTSDGTTGFDASEHVDHDQMIVVRGIPFWSMCEHHLLPFHGTADVGYIPGESGQVVGLSKLPRLVDLYARRLQLQERLTGQVAAALNEHLHPLGVAVRMEARHLCTACRGVRKDVTMVTSKLLGKFRDHAVRDEFWFLVGKQ